MQWKAYAFNETWPGRTVPDSVSIPAQDPALGWALANLAVVEDNKNICVVCILPLWAPNPEKACSTNLGVFFWENNNKLTMADLKATKSLQNLVASSKHVES